jgi:hypothetical protein
MSFGRAEQATCMRSSRAWATDHQVVRWRHPPIVGRYGGNEQHGSGAVIGNHEF